MFIIMPAVMAILAVSFFIGRTVITAVFCLYCTYRCMIIMFNLHGLLFGIRFTLLKMPSKFIRILRITFCYKQLCGRCLVHMSPVVKVVIHCVFALL